MRLIDADALIDRIRNPYEQVEVARWANEMPTIEPQRMRGRWIAGFCIGFLAGAFVGRLK